jgi:hypothetical protein
MEDINRNTELRSFKPHNCRYVSMGNLDEDLTETIKSKLKDIEILEEALSLDNEKKRRLIKLLEEMEKHSSSKTL